MAFERLLAKSWHGNGVPTDSVTLAGHLRSVYRAAASLLAATGRCQIAAVGLGDDWWPRFRQLVLVCAAVHDLGKANDHFQEAVRGLRGPDRPQALRHEWVALQILEREGWRTWLAPALIEPEDWHLMLWCIIGHHREPIGTPRPGSGSEMRVLLGHPDITGIMEVVADGLGLQSSAMPCSEDLLWELATASSDNPLVRLRTWMLEATQTWDRAFQETDVRRLLAAAKACLVAADVGGSALPRAGVSIERFVEASFQRTPKPDQLDEIVSDRLTPQGAKHPEPLRPFQSEVGCSESRVTFVRAGCGSGKTIAAYHWAAKQHPGKRLYFCYPTTGTATEGFRDYLFDAAAGEGKHGAELFHGRAHVDLELILDVIDDNGPDAQLRLDSLDAWSTPIVSCTVDTVLGLTQNHRRGLYAWPALAGAAFVFDEIHAYDDRLFSALLEFLTVCRGVPALLMSASLPSSRLEALKRKLRSVGEDLPAPITGPIELEQLPRYRREELPNNDPMPLVAGTLRENGKVLWVLNTVNRAMAAFDAATSAGLNPLLYHSRYRYTDRVIRHRDVIEAFRHPGPELAICTQVAEMSLDLSADLLVTDLAPVPSLIQRLGRLNRRARPAGPGQKPPATRPFLVVEPRRQDGTIEDAPYRTDDCPRPFDLPQRWLASLPKGGLSQSDLASGWELMDVGGRVRTSSCNWYVGGPLTEQGDLREPTPGLTVLLPQDAELVAGADADPVAVALPMNPPPRHVPWQGWRRVAGLPVAQGNAILYDAVRGGAWQAKE